MILPMTSVSETYETRTACTWYYKSVSEKNHGKIEKFLEFMFKCDRSPGISFNFCYSGEREATKSFE